MRAMIEVEVHLYNSLVRYVPRYEPLRLTLPEGAVPAEVARRLGIPEREIYAAWRNGHNILQSFGGSFEEGVQLDHGDRVALSGPIPFSRAYGAPVC
ncbi:MAG: hypothetical protein KF853_04245 [Rhodocyclaceae bacterium]|nr:hypothetical protein [Rhodocyclaceae bacterium]MCB1891465.1 hypothetical protein [Rhodocyclaceae bacterium]MCP5297783.1 hypothetical protein [Zoogloeaceae bacterium]MCW5596356.1 hypothetical protein [Rhodocyclaceae bacterium]PKO72138.1 MAG: hypothetical protein CVU20_04145 [Betaproteobacteria bacterium HGW-Betaproteobacteria-14]